MIVVCSLTTGRFFLACARTREGTPSCELTIVRFLARVVSSVLQFSENYPLWGVWALGVPFIFSLDIHCSYEYVVRRTGGQDGAPQESNPI